MKNNNYKLSIISPDGFTISFDETYESRIQAFRAFIIWRNRYSGQGYYSSVKFGRIPLNKLKHYCKLQVLNYGK